MNVPKAHRTKSDIAISGWIAALASGLCCVLAGLAFVLPQARAATNMDCEIKSRMERPDVMRVDAIVSGSIREKGTYSLKIYKQGKSGTSASVQSGRFSVPDSGFKQVSRSVFSLRDNDRYKVVLVVKAKENVVTCEKLLTSADTGEKPSSGGNAQEGLKL